MLALKLRWWSLQNWFKGYKFGPVQRFRCCDHTTPFHYQSCENKRTPHDRW
jgi:hypothetical protein